MSDRALQPNPEELPAVDLALIRRFTGGDVAEERELFAIFLEIGEEALANLTMAAGTGKNEPWRKSAHRLKGASGNLGANRLYQICHEAEISFTAGKERKDEMLHLISLALAEVEQFIKEHS